MQKFPATFPARSRLVWAAASLLSALLTAHSANAFVDGPDRTVSRLGDFAEWTLANPSFGGNPYDLQANAVFVHADSGERRTTPMFYAGGEQWKFRFTGSKSMVS